MRTATLFEGICFTILFYQLIKSATAKKVLIGTFVIFLALSLIDLTTSKAQNFDTIPTTVESLIFLSFSIFYFYEELQKINTSTFLYNTPTFWIISGIMIYFSGCFFFFIFAKQLISKPEFQIDFSQIMQSFSIIQLLFFLVAFIMAKSNSKNSPLHGTSKNPYPSLQTKEAFKP